MDYGKHLPFAGIIIGGTILSGPQAFLALAAVVAVVALGIRIAFRRGKEATQP